MDENKRMTELITVDNEGDCPTGVLRMSIGVRSLRISGKLGTYRNSNYQHWRLMKDGRTLQYT